MPDTRCPCCTTPIAVEASAEWLSCPICAHRWRLNTTTAEIGYYRSLISRNDTTTPWFKRKLGERSEVLQNFIADGVRRVLEIGCAEGLLGVNLKSKHEICYDGVELSHDATVAAGYLDHVFTDLAQDVISLPYDLIISFHVLEHIKDVEVEIRSWLRLLGNEGKILIEVPNHAGHPLLQHDTNHEHLHQFGVASIANLLNRCGLDIEYISRGHYESPVYPDSLRVVACRASTPTEKRERLIARFIEKLGGPFAIYGIGGDFKNYILPLLDELPVTALLDSSSEKQGQKVAGHQIEAYTNSTHGEIPLLISSIRFGAEIREYLRRQGIPEQLIVGLEEIYDPS